MMRCIAWVARITPLMLCALLLGGCGEGPVQDGATLRKVTFNMSWLPQGSMAGVFAAMEQGYYAEAGLEVEAVRGFGGIRTVNELDQGMFEFGYADPLAVMLNRRNGGDTRMIAAINDRWPAGLCFVEGRHRIEKPADLAGLTIGGGQNSPMQVIVPAWLQRNSVDPDSVTLLQLDPAVVAASVVENKIDAGECWLGNSRPVYEKRAREAGVSIGWLQYSSFGLDVYGNGLVTTERLILQEPALVQGFVSATLRGYAWAIANPDEATDILLAHHPVLDRGVTRAQLAEMAQLMRADHPGWMDEARVTNTVDFFGSAYAMERGIGAADIYTMQFVAAPPAPKE
jgi:NitT/TauT family transport system substrate-binding protein